MINQLNCNNFKFTVIGVQEVWNVPSGVNYKLPGYKPFHYTIRDKTGNSALVVTLGVELVFG